MRRLSRFPLHPFLFSLYPALAIIARNIDQVKPSAMGRAIVAVLILTALLLLVFKFIIKDWAKAGLEATWFLALFFTYGHIYLYLERHPIFGISLGRHRILSLFWLCLGGLGIWMIYKKIKDVLNATVTLNIVCILLLVFPLVKWVKFEVSTAREKVKDNGNLVLNEAQSKSPISNPDIYYIILDAYGRHDAILKQFKYDDTPFLNSLKEMGFYIAECSQSNYSQTPLTLMSTLNLNYLPDISNQFASGGTYTPDIWLFLKKSIVQQDLKELGYKIVGFESGYWFSGLYDADVFFSPKEKGVGSVERIEPINGIEALLIQTTGGILLADAASFLPSRLKVDITGPKIIHRNLILYILSKLPEVPVVVPGPKFVFVHLVSPHFPFVFGPNGEFVSYRTFGPDDWLTGYPQQAEYIGKRISNVVKKILEVSSRPPIIIIQGDHGYDFATPEARILILNAYYLPGGGEEKLYPTISPVNNFRLIFSYYFGMDFPLLEDQSYYSANWDEAYNFQKIHQGILDCAK